MSVYINQDVIRKKLKALKTNKRALNFAFDKALDRFGDLKEKMLEEFDEHPITQELIEGSNDPLGAENISNTLHGRGNLFTFIGFQRGTNPVEGVREISDNFTTLRKAPDVSDTDTGIRFKFPISVPSRDELEDATPMPWGTAKSWFFRVEKGGIRGLNYYIYWKMIDNEEVSRSGAGTMAKTRDGKRLVKLRDLEFQPMPYFTPILKKFIEKAKKG